MQRTEARRRSSAERRAILLDTARNYTLDQMTSSPSLGMRTRQGSGVKVCI